jgi:hypothetical protein
VTLEEKTIAQDRITGATGFSEHFAKENGQGEVVATVAGVGRSRSKACPHVHISAGMVCRGALWSELDWKNIGDPGVMTLIDPLQLIDRYYLVEEPLPGG